MIAEKRMTGTIDQIDGVVFFKSKFTFYVSCIITAARYCVSTACCTLYE